MSLKKLRSHQNICSVTSVQGLYYLYCPYYYNYSHYAYNEKVGGVFYYSF
jgi:hypothetical protein